jgi:dihydroxyacetone kinase
VTPRSAGDGKDSVVLLVNNLGGVSELELGAVGNEAVKWLRAKGIVVKRFLSGTYMVKFDCDECSPPRGC